MAHMLKVSIHISRHNHSTTRKVRFRQCNDVVRPMVWCVLFVVLLFVIAAVFCCSSLYVVGLGVCRCVLVGVAVLVCGVQCYSMIQFAVAVR